MQLQRSFEGVHLHLVSRSSDDLKRAAERLASRCGIRAQAHPVDLSNRNARDAFARSCADVDILVNCTGAIPGRALDQVSEDAWRAAWDLKLFGYVGITRIINTEMCHRRRGVIINVVGAGGLSTNAGYICALSFDADVHGTGGAAVASARAHARTRPSHGVTGNPLLS